jgi:hypothetical protein
MDYRPLPRKAHWSRRVHHLEGHQGPAVPSPERRPDRGFDRLSEEKESEDEGMFVDCEIYHDSIGVTHFLPPKRCRNCDD